MANPRKIARAGPSVLGMAVRKDPAGSAIAKTRATMRYNAVWIRVSMARARKRLPIPAKGNSRAICSGVSILSWSVEFIPSNSYNRVHDDFHALAGETQTVLEQAGDSAGAECEQ